MSGKATRHILGKSPGRRPGPGECVGLDLFQARFKNARFWVTLRLSARTSPRQLSPISSRRRLRLGRPRRGTPTNAIASVDLHSGGTLGCAPFSAGANGRLVWAAHDVPGLIASRAHTSHRSHARTVRSTRCMVRGQFDGAGVRSRLAIDPCLVASCQYQSLFDPGPKPSLRVPEREGGQAAAMASVT